jgi:hypothetical protein
MTEANNCMTNVIIKRSTRNATRVHSQNAAIKKNQKEVRMAMMELAVKMYKDAVDALTDDNKNVPPCTFKSIREAFGNPPWLNRDAIYYHIKKSNNNKPPENNNCPIQITNVDNSDPELSDITTDSGRNMGGRPAGRCSGKEYIRKLEEARILAANVFLERKQSKATKLANGELTKIIEDSVLSVGLHVDDQELIPSKTIRSRVYRDNHIGYAGSYSTTSPMIEIEPLLVELCRHLNRMALSITKEEFLALANDIIVDTPTSERLRLYHQRICGKDKLQNRLGTKYFYNFMRRHSNIIHHAKIRKCCINRLEWATYKNISKMYTLVYQAMIRSGVANEINQYRYFDKNNEIVEDGDKSAFGTKSNVIITDPSFVLFVDETGSSTNMRKDKPGSKKVIAEKGYSGTQAAISSDIRYTTMGFTAATGEPVMCVIIFCSESTKGIPGNWLTGIDITKIDSTLNLNDDRETLVNNLKLIANGGPTCKFRGVDVPCLVQHSPHGGITPLILTNCLRQLDELNLFPRTITKQPFVLLDGHDSRFNLDFLKYIRDEQHPWTVCIGLPYGTHLWQVGDSHAQNGNYKHYEQVYKDILLKEKIERGMALTLKPTDVVPIVNYAWERSFAIRVNNIKAILDRGWYPANRALEVHPDVLRTKQSSDGSNVFTSQSTSSSTITCDLNGINTKSGTAAVLLEAAINNHRNDPTAMRKRKERKELASKTRLIEETTRKLTSGVAFFNDMVALNGDAVWEHQNKWYNERKAKDDEKRDASRKLFNEKKMKCDNIRMRQKETWTVNDISTLLTYKRQKNDIAVKSFKSNRTAMLVEWDNRSHRPTPPPSPTCVEIEETYDFTENENVESYEL